MRSSLQFSDTITRSTISPSSNGDHSTLGSTSPWSSAVGRATNGKSGRVIEKLQGDVDRLNRDLTVERLRCEEAEKQQENMSVQISNLQESNSNLKQAHEADSNAIARKDRKIQELKSDLQEQKTGRIQAEEASKVLARVKDEAVEKNRTEAARANALVEQANAQCGMLLEMRDREKFDHYTTLKKKEDDRRTLYQTVQVQEGKIHSYEILAEKQNRLIVRLEEENRQLTADLAAHSAETDANITQLRLQCEGNNEAIDRNLAELHQVEGEMQRVVNIGEVRNARVMAGHSENQPPSNI